MRVNNKGFTLVEMLAVIVILGVLATIMVPTVTSMIRKNQQDNLKNLNKSIISAAKMYMSDNRYEITLDGQTCGGGVTKRSITYIGEQEIKNSQITVQTLIKNDYLTDGDMLNEDGEEINRDKSYIEVVYDCNKKDYTYGEPYLK